MFETGLDNNLRALGLDHWLPQLHALLQQRLSAGFHGDYTKWQTALAQLPAVTPSDIDLNHAVVRVGQATDIAAGQLQLLEHSLRQLHPWRKGPFELFGLYIDTEWRSDWKWDRLKEYLAPVSGRKILDIGCGSGYHCWRMRGAGAGFVLGIDPTLLFVMQFNALQHYIQDPQVQVLPLGTEELPPDMGCFDSVFSMGLLYHRRNPQQHIQELKNCLREEGELVLETLVIDERHGDVLVPDGRYARMRNVWAIPSVPVLLDWLRQGGLRDVRCVDVTVTSRDEQRRTDWMQFQSLSDNLDPADPGRTVEGYPAPRRAICIARK